MIRSGVEDARRGIGGAPALLFGLSLLATGGAVVAALADGFGAFVLFVVLSAVAAGGGAAAGVRDGALPRIAAAVAVASVVAATVGVLAVVVAAQLGSQEPG